MSSPRPGLMPALALLFNAFVWGVSWWPFRELHEAGLHPLWATALIYAVSMVLLLAARPRAWQALAREPMLWVLGIASGLTNVGFNWGVTVGDVVRVVLLFYLMPAWSVILAWILLGEQPTRGAAIRLVIAMAGVVTVLKAPGEPWPVPEGAADWLAIAGGFSFALTNITLRRLRRVEAPARIFSMFAGGAVLASTAALLGMGMGAVAAPPALALPWGVIALALSLSFLCSNMALQYGATRLHAHTTAIIMLSEVVFASVSSVALGAAGPTARTMLGGALILAAAMWSACAREEGQDPARSAA